MSNTKKKKESFITLDVEMEDYCRIKNEGKISGHRQVSLTIEPELIELFSLAND